MIVSFEGTQYKLPDDATQEEITTILGQANVQKPTQFDEQITASRELQTPIQFGRTGMQAPFEIKSGAFPEEVLRQEPISNADLWNKGIAKTGKSAIKAVEKMEGRKLSDKERRVVELEGFSPVPYLDSRGNVTIGVGQTKEFAKQSFSASFKAHEKRAASRIHNYDQLPEWLQTELIQAEYRGDLGGSPTFRKLFNAGKYADAAQEFLDNDDYRESLSEGSGIAGRMEAVANAVARFAKEDTEARQRREQELEDALTPKDAEGLAKIEPGLYQDEDGNVFHVDAEGNRKEV
jgi:GH24 family phage-related lysozyme (muramidase)